MKSHSPTPWDIKIFNGGRDIDIISVPTFAVVAKLTCDSAAA